MAKARVTSKGQVTVPKSIRQRLGVQPGDDLVFDVRGNRVTITAQRRRTVGELAGIFRTSRVLRNERANAWTRETRRLGRTGTHR